MKPNEDRVLLKPIAPETETASGILIPLEAQKIKLWEVVAIGPACHGVCEDCKGKIATKLEIGMVVLININAGEDFVDEGEDRRIVRYKDIHTYDDKKQ